MAMSCEDRSMRIHDLELARQHRIHQVELVKRDEDARRIKLKAIALKNDHATLKDSLSQKDSYYRLWMRQRDQLRTELDEARDMIRSHETRARKQSLEVTNLKAEVDSLTTSMQDSGKALQEKFTLTRELNRLRPELEHLQSQLTNHQAVVAEKHDLRRQVDSLEVELENERRVRQRAKAKNDDGELEDIRQQLREAEKRLASHRKEKEKMKRDHETALADARSRCEQLEEDQSAALAKLETSQAELKSAHDQLGSLRQQFEDCRSELDKANSSTSTSTSNAHNVTVPLKAEAPAKATGPKSKKPAKGAPEPRRKRSIEETGLDDVSIGTPGNESMLARPAKKRGAEHVARAEKSTFSITPFLNRNKGLDDVTLEDTPVAARASGEDTNESMGDRSEPPPRPSPKKAPAAKGQKPRGRPPKASTLAEKTVSRKNTAASQSSSQDATAAVCGNESLPTGRTEEQENVPSPGKKAKQASRANLTTSANDSQAQVEAKAPEGERKRKRKLVGTGTTLFDEDDAEPVRPMAGNAIRRVKSTLGGGGSGFGAFSPLKRHKRGMNASYLA